MLGGQCGRGSPLLQAAGGLLAGLESSKEVLRMLPNKQGMLSRSICLIFLLDLTCTGFPVLQGRRASGSSTRMPYLRPSRCRQQLKRFITSCFWWHRLPT